MSLMTLLLMAGLCICLGTVFGDFFATTREKLASDPNKLLNQSSKYRTYLWRKMLRGLANKEVFQGGTKLIDYIQLEFNPTWQNYNPTGEFSFTGSNSLTQIEMNWRCWLIYMTWTDHELELNQGTSMAEKMKNLRAHKRRQLDQDWWEGGEDALWATPNKLTMEAGHVLTPTATVGQTYSLRAFITKDGLAPSSTNGGVTGSGGDWTTVMGISPTDFANWRNQVETYDSTQFDSAILDAFDLMWLDLQWESPESAQQYVQDTKLNKLVITASKKGYAKLVRNARLSNDNLVPRGNFSEMNGQLTYHGIPIKHIGALDTVDATDDAADKPNYRWLNFSHIKPKLHATRNRKIIEPAVSANQPFQHVLLEDTWGNVWLDNRREQGMVSAA